MLDKKTFVLPAPYTQVTKEFYAEVIEIGGTQQACFDFSSNMFRGFV
jgi:hypothetical protein